MHPNFINYMTMLSKMYSGAAMALENVFMNIFDSFDRHTAFKIDMALVLEQKVVRIGHHMSVIKSRASQ